MKHLIYPVPNPDFPFLGVHYTRMIGGHVEAGPNAVLALAREGYRKTDVDLADLRETLAFGGSGNSQSAIGERVCERCGALSASAHSFEACSN